MRLILWVWIGTFVASLMSLTLAMITPKWPKKTNLWYEESNRRAARQLKLTGSGCRVERCCFDGDQKGSHGAAQGRQGPPHVQW